MAIAVGTAALISWGIDLSSGIIRKRRAKRNPEKQDVPEYEFSGNCNPDQAGGALPICYGMSKVSGYLIATRVEDDKTGQALYVVGSGVMQGPSDVNSKDLIIADGLRAGSNSGVGVVDFRSGTNNQEPVEGFGGSQQVGNVSPPDKVLSEAGESIEIPGLSKETKFFTVKYNFPWGFYHSRKNRTSSHEGGMQRVIIKGKNSDGDWQVLKTQFDQSDRWLWCGRPSIKERTVTVYRPAGDTHTLDIDVSVEFDHTGYDGCLSDPDDQSYKKDINAVTVKHVACFAEDATNSYLGNAYHSIVFNENEENRGVVPTFGFLDAGILVPVPGGSALYTPPTYNNLGDVSANASLTVTDEWDYGFDESYCNDPVWLVYYLLTNSKNGIAGRTINAISIDLDSFFIASKHNCELIDDLTQETSDINNKINRYTFNYQMVTQSEVWAQCNDILMSCRAQLYWRGDKIFIYQDRLENASNYIYLDDNNVIDAVYYGQRLNDSYTSASTSFSDQKYLWETTSIKVALPSSDVIDRIGKRELDCSFTGSTNRSQSTRLALFAVLDTLSGFDLYGIEPTPTIDGICSCKIQVGFSNSQIEIGNVVNILDAHINSRRMLYRVVNIVKLDEATLELSCIKYWPSKYELVEGATPEPPPPTDWEVTAPVDLQIASGAMEVGYINSNFFVSFSWGQELLSDGNPNNAVMYYELEWTSKNSFGEIVESGSVARITSTSYILTDRRIYPFSETPEEIYSYRVRAVFPSAFSEWVTSDELKLMHSGEPILAPSIDDEAFRSPDVILKYYDLNAESYSGKEVIYAYEFAVCSNSDKPNESGDSANVYALYRVETDGEKILQVNAKTLVYSHSSNITDTGNSRGTRKLYYNVRSIAESGVFSEWDTDEVSNPYPVGPIVNSVADVSSVTYSVTPAAVDASDYLAFYYQEDGEAPIRVVGSSFVLGPASGGARETNSVEVWVEDIFGVKNPDPNVTEVDPVVFTDAPIPAEGFALNDLNDVSADHSSVISGTKYVLLYNDSPSPGEFTLVPQTSQATTPDSIIGPVSDLDQDYSYDQEIASFKFYKDLGWATSVEWDFSTSLNFTIPIPESYTLIIYFTFNNNIEEIKSLEVSGSASLRTVKYVGNVGPVDGFNEIKVFLQVDKLIPTADNFRVEFTALPKASLAPVLPDRGFIRDLSSIGLKND